MRENRAFPVKIQNAPEICPGLEFFYKAFLDLNSCRGIGYGEEGPIPWTAMAQYCERKDVDLETEDDLYFIVRSMDNDYLSWKRERAKREHVRADKGAKRGK